MPLDFDQLRAERREIRDFVGLHEASVLDFVGDGVKELSGRPNYADCSWFRLTADEIVDDDKKRPPHLSTSASCLESLADAVVGEHHRLGGDRLAFAQNFTTRALDADPRSWRSEGAADVYCRARTLPAVLRFHSDWTEQQREHATRLLREIFVVVDVTDPAHGGVMEWPLYPNATGRLKRPDFAKPNTRSMAYPPNAFHTYWALQAFEVFGKTLPEEHATLGSDMLRRVRTARAWTLNALSTQTALISGRGSRVDAQQLGYAIATNVRHEGERLVAGSQRHELLRAALGAFFSQQDDTGDFPQSQPLFHYPAAGNAYCYVFETLTELLRPALPRESGRVYRDLLREHASCLIKAWHLARRTRVLLKVTHGEDARAPHYGWSSAHQAFRRQPEGWATAAVYSYLQALRRLLGHWTAEEAGLRVGATVSRYPTIAAGREMLRDRGQTWPTDSGWTLSRRLASMFLHPRTKSDPLADVCDPDAPLIAENEARSALLFGPPGTGKTTIVQALAGALGWQYVEIQAAQFLAEGMDRVPARADEIFAALMELDRCVILFDEIDELIRLRTDSQTDPFGRFLTTSMLPKLAQLWEQRRVLFFANTNHVDKADPAIRRSQRFDAALLVMPPNFEKKITMLPDGWTGAIDATTVKAALENRAAEEELDPLGVLALLRFDQMSQLDGVRAGDIDALRKRLGALAIEIARNDWVGSEPNKPSTAAHGDKAAAPATEEDECANALWQLYAMYAEYRDQERIDQSRRCFVIAPAAMTGDGLVSVEALGDGRCLARLVDRSAINGRTDEYGRVAVSVNGAEFADDGLLEFRETTGTPQTDELG